MRQEGTRNSNQKEKGGTRTEKGGKWMNVTDIMSSRAGGRGQRSFTQRKTQGNGQVGKEAELSGRNDFSKRFSRLSHLTADLKFILIKKLF